MWRIRYRGDSLIVHWKVEVRTCDVPWQSATHGEDELGECGDGPETDHISPATLPREEYCVDEIREDLWDSSAREIAEAECGAQVTHLTCAIDQGQQSHCS